MALGIRAKLFPHTESQGGANASLPEKMSLGDSWLPPARPPTIALFLPKGPRKPQASSALPVPSLRAAQLLLAPTAPQCLVPLAQTHPSSHAGPNATSHLGDPGGVSDLLILVQEPEELLPGMLSVLLLMQKDPHHGSHRPEDSLLVLDREGRGSAWRA